LTVELVAKSVILHQLLQVSRPAGCEIVFLVVALSKFDILKAPQLKGCIYGRI
jgi:hypothetical protein